MSKSRSSALLSLRSINNLQSFGSHTRLLTANSFETERELWSVYLYLADGHTVKLATVNVVTPKHEITAHADFKWQDLLDTRIWFALIVGVGAVWFTSRKTRQMQELRELKRRESDTSAKGSKDAIDGLQRKLNALNQKFAQ